MLTVLRNRNAAVYLVGQAFSLFGDNMLWLAAGIWVKTLTGSSTAAGLLFFVFALPQLAGPFAGVLVDRARRRPLLVAANLLVGSAVAVLLLVHDRGDIWLIYAVMGAYGAAFTVFSAGQSALLSAMLPVDQLATCNSALQTTREGLRLIAPLAGAALFAWQGPKVVILIDVATFAVAALSLVLLRVREEPASETRLTRANLAGGWRHLMTTRPLRYVVLATAAILVVVGFSETLVYAITDEGLHRPPTFIAVLLSVQGAGAVVGGAVAAFGIRRWTELRVSTLGIAAFGFSALLMAVPQTAVVITGVFLFGLGLTWVVVAEHTLLQRSTPSSLQGRAFATAELLGGAPQTVSIAIGATLIAVAGYRVPLFVMAAISVAVTTYLRLKWSAAGTPAQEYAGAVSALDRQFPPAPASANDIEPVGARNTSAGNTPGPLRSRLKGG